VLRRYGEVLRLLLMGADLALTAAAWLGTYQLRFLSGTIPVVRGMPPEELYYFSTWAVLLIFHLVFRRAGLYEPWRIKSFAAEAAAVVRSVALGVVVLLIVSFLSRYQSTNYSRLFLMVFVPLNIGLLLGARIAARWVLRALRRSGHNLRHVLVVGAGPLARQVVDRAAANPWTGLRIVGMLADEGEDRSPHRGVEVLGAIEDLGTTMEQLAPQQVFIALPFERFARIKRTMMTLADSFATVRIVADLFDFGLVMNGSVDDFDGLPVLNLVDKPIVGMQATVKRLFDVAFSGLVLSLLFPWMVLLAIAVKLSVKGPVFYRQERMGLDGRRFEIIKFRTMPQGSESASGPVWASSGDARPTRLGALMRRMSLDELPQFWNVFKGEMSVVGPRPERPVFIEKFRQDIPRYHQRHMVRAGITGWAQVNGWRGDTELAPRIAHDLYYIENWSLALDLKIIAMTVLRVFHDPNAH
jgi:exopolysaccharide biosynthesis polyprenyl glycosylphosphotransferase